MRPKTYWIVLLLATFTVPAILALKSCNKPTYQGKPLLLEWHDGDRTFRVTESPGAIVKQNASLHVERGRKAESILIDDDAIFGTITFVRYENWLLVVCRDVNQVWAGYNYDSGKLFGEYDWAALPLTRWDGQGDVVAEHRTGRSAASPADLPH